MERKFIDLVHDVGLDEISFNIDIIDPKTAKVIIPGKFKEREIFVGMLKYSVRIFGERRVSSFLAGYCHNIDQ